MATQVFEDMDGPNAVRPDLPFVERQAVLVVLRHWSEDLYLGLKWKKVDWETLITGGIEEGLSPITAAMEEIRQETGYASATLERFLPPVDAKFYHVPKRQNRHAHFTVLAMALCDGERVEVSHEEAAIHEPVWLTAEEISKFRLPPAQRYAWDRYLEKDTTPKHPKVRFLPSSAAEMRRFGQNAHRAANPYGIRK